MKQKLKNTVQVCMMIFSVSVAFAQSIPETEKKENTIKNQFEEMLSSSSNYQNYKVIDKAILARFQKNITDTLNAMQTEMSVKKGMMANHENEIKKLNNAINELKTTLQQTEDQKDSMSIFGLLISKGAYSLFMWALVLGLGVLLFSFIYKFKNSDVVTQKSLQDLNELEEEYENYRKLAIEREQKVRRQLQDEINKNKHKDSK